MRDPYLYDDVDVLVNYAHIKDARELQKAEADITSLTMIAVYNTHYEKFDTETLLDIHAKIFGNIYPWAGMLRTIQMVKHEEVLGGDSVVYAYPREIKKQLKEIMNEIPKLKRIKDENEIVFRLVRIIARIWQIHPFREGNTRCVMAFAVLLASNLGFRVDFKLFQKHALYVRNALVWCSQGIYSKYEYLERIFFDAILHKNIEEGEHQIMPNKKYDLIENYEVKNYQEQPHIYIENSKD